MKDRLSDCSWGWVLQHVPAHNMEGSSQWRCLHILLSSQRLGYVRHGEQSASSHWLKAGSGRDHMSEETGRGCDGGGGLEGGSRMVGACSWPAGGGACKAGGRPRLAGAGSPPGQAGLTYASLRVAMAAGTRSSEEAPSSLVDAEPNGQII